MRYLILSMIFLLVNTISFANSAPTVTNVVASQRSDGSGIVDIYYTLSDADNDECTVTIAVSDDSGATWDVAATALSGDIGADIRPGRRHIEWASKVDLPGVCSGGYQFRVTANDSSDPLGLTWVYISDPGVPGHEGFDGEMSKYETTNAQYCAYLNSALASGAVRIQSGDVYGNSGPYSGQIYFDMSSSYAQISYSGGSFYVESRDGHSMANHPVVEVSWYGATAFASYYGWRLPTEWEWQAVADYNGSYTYGCGTTINHSKANYYDSGYANPLNLSTYPYTSPVGYYPAYGYGLCDMAGNVLEWTSSCYYGDCRYGDRVLRGGSWGTYGSGCEVSNRDSYGPYGTYYSSGFRVCR